MKRLWLSLLLLLALWPNPAAAEETVARASGDQLSSANTEYFPDVIRSLYGIELLSRADTPLPDSSRRTAPGAPIQHRSEFAWSRMLECVGDRPGSSDDTVAPLCERLPYDATAPPSLR